MCEREGGEEGGMRGSLQRAWLLIVSEVYEWSLLRDEEQGRSGVEGRGRMWRRVWVRRVPGLFRTLCLLSSLFCFVST
jgi:hypothetical protein